MKEGYVQSARHGGIHYVEAGSGKPLVLLHSKELALVLVLRSMVLELVRSSLTSTNEASKAIP